MTLVEDGQLKLLDAFENRIIYAGLEKIESCIADDGFVPCATKPALRPRKVACDAGRRHIFSNVDGPAIYLGASKTIATIIDRSRADLWIMPVGSQSFEEALPLLSESWAERFIDARREARNIPTECSPRQDEFLLLATGI